MLAPGSPTHDFGAAVIGDMMTAAIGDMMASSLFAKMEDLAPRSPSIERVGPHHTKGQGTPTKGMIEGRIIVPME